MLPLGLSGQRKQNSLVPVAEALAGLSLPVQAPHDATPQARHHFTLADQVNALVSASEADPDKASDKQTVKVFRRQALREWKKIKLAWPELNYTTAPGVLILHPSTPAIPPLNQGQLVS